MPGWKVYGDVPWPVSTLVTVTACDGLRQCKVQFAGIENSTGFGRETAIYRHQQGVDLWWHSGDLNLLT
jgi:hypothetical protein